MLTRKLSSFALSLAIVTAPMTWSASALAHGPTSPADDSHWQTDKRGQTSSRQGDHQRQTAQHGPERRDVRGQKASPGPQRHTWRTGNTLPPAYRNRHHVVQDWQHHRLPEPPRGQRWVEVDGEFVLIAVATGIIVSVMAGAGR